MMSFDGGSARKPPNRRRPPRQHGPKQHTSKGHTSRGPSSKHQSSKSSAPKSPASKGSVSKSYRKAKPVSAQQRRKAEPAADVAPKGPRHMGSVARKGAARLAELPTELADSHYGSGRNDGDDATEDLSPEEVEEARLRLERREARQARTQQLRSEAKEAVQRGSLADQPPSVSQSRKLGRRRVALPAADGTRSSSASRAQTLPEAVGERNAYRYRQRLERASVAYENEDYHKAWGVLGAMVKDAPRVVEVRELTGLTLYRLGRWALAAAELEALRELTGRVDLHPVLADCYRAQRRWADVDTIWAELQASQPTSAVLIEGQIVAAGALGDKGEYQSAVRLLSVGFQLPRRAKEHHMRQAYALADLCEQAGEIPRSRDLFSWLYKQDELYVDVAERLHALR